jgi:glycosyltransferase involved in cell wall biosynthesis
VDPLISFCIRGWRASTVGGAIESALAQTVDRIEVVVADDKGDLEPVVRSFEDPRVRYHRNAERLGPSWNAREALDLGRGELLFLLNDDDRLLPTFAERTLERFAEVPRAGIVLTNLYLEEGGRRRVRDTPFADGTYDDFLLLFLRRFWVGDSALLRRAVWEEGERAHPIPPDTVAGAYVMFRAAVMGVAISYLDEPLLVWNLHDESVSGSLAARDLMVSLWSSFELADPEAERLRLDHLAHALVNRAGARLRTRRYAEARADLAAARALGERARIHWLFARLRLPVGPALALKRRLPRWRERAQRPAG